MPGTIFDAQAADADGRDRDFQEFLADVVRYAAAPRRVHRAATAPLGRRAAAIEDAQYAELKDIELWTVVDHAAWDEAVAPLVPFYSPSALGIPLAWRASRDFRHRLAAIETLPVIAERLQRFLAATRTQLARVMMRTLPGGSTPHALLSATRGHLFGGGGLDELRVQLLEVWRATDPERLRSFEMLPRSARDRAYLMDWSIYEVVTWLERHHCEGKRVFEHVIIALGAGGWTDELGADPWTMPDNVRKAFEREAARRGDRPRAVFES